MHFRQPCVDENPTLKTAECYFLQLQLSRTNSSLLKRYLTIDVFEALESRSTPTGGSLADVIKSGAKNVDSRIGVYATDAACYQVFALLFDPIIQSYHKLLPGFVQPPVDFGDPMLLKNLDPHGEYVLSTRVRCGRSLEGYPFNSWLSEDQYRQIERTVSGIFKTFPADLEGEYRSLASLSDRESQQLIQEHLLFKPGDRFLQAAGACRYWPAGRGIFYNKAKTCIVWVNEEDHLRLMSMQKGADLSEVYARLVRTIHVMESAVQSARDDRLGYLSSCPTNLGTALRASVHIRLPHLAKNHDLLMDIARQNNLQVRGTSGEHSGVQDSVFDISNKRRCGVTEFEAVWDLQEGVYKVIAAEKLCAKAVKQGLHWRTTISSSDNKTNQ